MTRSLVLRCHVEGAAYKYKHTSPGAGKTPSQNLKYLAKIEGACDLLLEEIRFFELLPFRIIDRMESPNIEEKVDEVLTTLKEQILKQKEISTQQIIPRGKRHKQNTALHNLLLSLCDAWEYILEREVPEGGGSVGGPLIRFIQSVITPLGLNKTPNAVREMLKDLKVKSKKIPT